MADGFNNADELELLEDDATPGNPIARLLVRAPLVAFGILSVLALGVIVLVVAFSQGQEDAAPPQPELPAVLAQQQLVEQMRATMRLAEERTFLQALHPLLTLEEIAQEDVPQNFLAEEMLRLKHIELALTVDIRAALRSAGDKPAAFDTLLANLIGIDQRASIAYARLIDLAQVLDTRIAALEDREKLASKQLDASLAVDSSSIANDALAALVDARERRAVLETRRTLVEGVLDQYPGGMERLRARIAGARANRELLIRDLVAVDIDDAGLTLIREGKVEEFYRAQPIPSRDLPPRFDGVVTSDAVRLTNLPVANSILNPPEQATIGTGDGAASGGSFFGSSSGGSSGARAHTGATTGDTGGLFGADNTATSGGSNLRPYGWDGTETGFFSPVLVDDGSGVPYVTFN